MKMMNLPDYAEKYEFWIGREVDGDMWFYGAYETAGKALQVAREIGGELIHNMKATM